MVVRSDAEIQQIDAIWEGDKLQRKAEAAVLESFLKSEVDALAAQDRDQAIVLALDSQYGEGKSWFLSRFRKQLEVYHPVAFVDAWVDDGNNEPLISIMAALNQGLADCLKERSTKDHLAGLTRAALPIIGKAVVGAGGKFVSKYLGEAFAGDAKETLKAASSKDDKDGALEAGIEKAFEGVSEVVDEYGKAMLDQYLARQDSRAAFKENLRKLAAGIGKDSGNDRYPPIFVVVDELDRCRPDYAISLLEEIKHLFDVRGVVFVIALHGNQLVESIKAVYGANFNAKAYLRRFFTRHYALRKLSIRELVVEQFGWVPLEHVTFSSPPVWEAGRAVEANQIELAGDLLTFWDATPREAIAVMDGLRLFLTGWAYKVPIEMPLVIGMLLRLVRGEDVIFAAPDTRGRSDLAFATVADPFGRSPANKHDPNEYFGAYATAAATSLVQINKNNYNGGVHGYIGSRMNHELAVRYNNSWRNDQEPRSTWEEYRDRIIGIGRFIQDVGETG